MKKVVILLFLLFCVSVFSQDKVLKIDFRHRPPEMVVDKNGEISGPLKDIFDEIGARTGYTVEWRVAPFNRSLAELKTGDVDVVPRVLRNEEREGFIYFLNAIGYQKKDITFLVKKGEEGKIKSYTDLSKVKIGVKRGTVYFDQFDHDKNLKKMVATDDLNLARMFMADRFDTMIVLDKKAIETELSKDNFKNFSYADYVYPNMIGNYFGMSKKSPHFNNRQLFDSAIADMASEGVIDKIYMKYNTKPPLQK